MANNNSAILAVAVVVIAAGAGGYYLTHPSTPAPLPPPAGIEIGMQGPTSGPNAAFGEQMARGFQQAVADINAAGGVLGQPLLPTVGDDACDPKQAVSVATSMVGKGVVFVDGGFCSSASIPASSVYADGGVLQISPASTNPALTDDAATKGWVNVFRVCGRDDQQGRVAGEYLAKTFAGKNVAVIDDKSTYGKGLADITRATIKGLGLNDADDEEITVGDKDFSALISKLKSLNVSAIYFGGYVTEAGLIVRQAQQQGLPAVLMTGDSLATQDFWQITGPVGAGTVFTFSPDPMKNASAASVVAEFTKQGFKPEGYTLYSYAAVQVFAQAATLAHSTKLADISKAMHSNTFNTVIGPVTFDAKGDPTAGGYVVWQWQQDGNYHQL